MAITQILQSINKSIDKQKLFDRQKCFKDIVCIFFLIVAWVVAYFAREDIFSPCQ